MEEELVSTPLVGGAPSGPSVQFHNRESADHTLAGVYLTGAFSRTVGITQAAHPVSGPLLITRSAGNRIEELRGRPALEHLVQLIRELPPGPVAPKELLIGLPIDPADTELTTGNYVVRPITDTDPSEGAIITTEEMTPGRPLSFVARDPKRAREELEERAAALSEELLSNPPRFGLYIKNRRCGKRFYASENVDLGIIRRHFGTIPLIGFFSNGELAPEKGVNTFHQHAGILILISDPLE